jgi:toxoflavin biosynthesis protein ToxC
MPLEDFLAIPAPRRLLASSVWISWPWPYSASGSGDRRLFRHVKEDVFVVVRHVGPISGVAAHEDRYIATGDDDGRVILWEKGTGKSINSSLHDDAVNNCAFSGDGQYLVTSSNDCTVRLWSVPDLSLKAVLADHGDDVTMSVFHPADELIATASRDYFVRVYDFDARLVAKFGGVAGDLLWLDWAEDGRELVALSDGGQIKRWVWALTQPIEASGPSTAEHSGHAPAGTSAVLDGSNDCGQAAVNENRYATRVGAHGERVVIDPQESLLACISDGALGVWDISTPNPVPVAATILPDDVWARSCAFAGLSRLVFKTFSAGCRIYDYLRNEWRAGDIAPVGGVHAVCVRGDDVITVDDSGTIRCNGAHLAGVGSLCNFLVAGDVGVVAGGQAGTVMDAISGRMLYAHSAPLHCGISVTFDGSEHLIAGSYSGEVLMLGWEGRSLVHVKTVQLHVGAVTGLACSGGVVFSTCADRSVAWHSLTGWQELHRIALAHQRAANGCVALGDGYFASAGRDLTLRIWNRGYDCVTIYPPMMRSIGCVAACPQGGVIAIGSYGGHVARYDATTHQLLSLDRPTTAGISAIVFSAARDAFLCSSYDGQVYPVPANCWTDVQT